MAQFTLLEPQRNTCWNQADQYFSISTGTSCGPFYWCVTGSVELIGQWGKCWKDSFEDPVVGFLWLCVPAGVFLDVYSCWWWSRGAEGHQRVSRASFAYPSSARCVNKGGWRSVFTAPHSRRRIHMQSTDGCNNASSPLFHLWFLSFLFCRFIWALPSVCFPLRRLKRGWLCSGL